MAFEAELKVIRTEQLVKAIAVAPAALEIQLADAFDHTKRKFFKEWARLTKVKFTPRKGILNHFFGVVDRRETILDALRLRIFTFSDVAEVHEKGGVIRARGGKKLRIPIRGTSSVTKRGRVQKSLRKLKPREDKRFFVIPGTDVIYRRFRGKNARVEPAFLLKESIRIRPRLRFAFTWDKLESFRADRFNKAISRALRDVAKKG